jgi:hypothetical protein
MTTFYVQACVEKGRVAPTVRKSSGVRAYPRLMFVQIVDFVYLNQIGTVICHNLKGHDDKQCAGYQYE